jgi:hypothetical protein
VTFSGTFELFLAKNKTARLFPTTVAVCRIGPALFERKLRVTLDLMRNLRLSRVRYSFFNVRSRSSCPLAVDVTRTS